MASLTRIQATAHSSVRAVTRRVNEPNGSPLRRGTAGGGSDVAEAAVGCVSPPRHLWRRSMREVGDDGFERLRLRDPFATQVLVVAAEAVGRVASVAIGPHR